MYMSHKITTPKDHKNKQNKEKQISSENCTNNEGHITANEYSIQKALPDTGPGGLLSCETSRLPHCLDN
jgi:hypothetical protein